MVLSNPIHFRFLAKGHVNILATHASTFEVTMEPYITHRGDCIIGVESTHAAQHLKFILGDALRHPNSQVQTILSVGDVLECIQGTGSPHLLLSSPTSLVWRTSDYIDERTIAINCDKAARDFNPDMIELLQTPETILQIALSVFSGDT